MYSSSAALACCRSSAVLPNMKGHAELCINLRMSSTSGRRLGTFSRQHSSSSSRKPTSKPTLSSLTGNMASSGCHSVPCGLQHECPTKLCRHDALVGNARAPSFGHAKDGWTCRWLPDHLAAATTSCTKLCRCSKLRSTHRSSSSVMLAARSMAYDMSSLNKYAYALKLTVSSLLLLKGLSAMLLGFVPALPDNMVLVTAAAVAAYVQ